jgi:ubiquitin-activating enzyme E1
MPIRQYLYFDAIECLPENIFQAPSEGSTESPAAPELPTKKSRYYSQELIFGADFQKKLGQTKYFVVRAQITFLSLSLSSRSDQVQSVVKC